MIDTIRTMRRLLNMQAALFCVRRCEAIRPTIQMVAEHDHQDYHYRNMFVACLMDTGDALLI